MFKRCTVVMLPIKEKAEDCLIKCANLFFKYKKGYYTQEYLKSIDGQAFHLYIITDEEIKEGDWFYDGESVLQCSRVTDVIIDTQGQWSNIKTSRKIIATTDKSLTTDNRTFIFAQSERRHLSQPSESFIQRFIEEYNKGNVITDVMVEYAEHRSKQGDYEGEYLKINPKDNTITIRKVKDTWTREEVIELVNNWRKTSGENNILTKDTFNKWIAKNL